jgi:hypothetical protein
LVTLLSVVRIDPQLNGWIRVRGIVGIHSIATIWRWTQLATGPPRSIRQLTRGDIEPLRGDSSRRGWVATRFVNLPATAG